MIIHSLIKINSFTNTKSLNLLQSSMFNVCNSRVAVDGAGLVIGVKHVPAGYVASVLQDFLLLNVTRIIYETLRIEELLPDL